MMSTTLKLIEQSFNTTHLSLHMTSQHATKWHQDHNKQVLHNDPQRNLNNYLEKAEEKPDGRNSIATDHLATKPAPWRVKYNGKLRKINVFVNDPQRNSNNYLEKAEEKPDGRNSIATDYSVTKCTPWRVEYNGKLRKINVFVNGIPIFANILPLYEHYVCVTPCQVHIKGF